MLFIELTATNHGGKRWINFAKIEEIFSTNDGSALVLESGREVHVHETPTEIFRKTIPAERSAELG